MSFFGRASKPSHVSSSRAAKRTASPRLEGLEDRTLLSGGVSERQVLAVSRLAIVNSLVSRPPARKPNLTATITSGPAINGKVTLSGQTYQRATVQVDLDANGTIDQTLKADRRGKFSTTIFVGYGVSQIKLTGVLRGKAPATSVLSVNRPDSFAPSISLTSLKPSARGSSQVVITGRANDVGSGVNAITVSINNGPIQGVAVDSAGNFTYVSSFPLNGSADGTYVFAFTARDRAGNASVPIAAAYTLDTTGPVIALTSPAQGLLTATNPTITGQVNDAGGAGVASLQWRIDNGAYSPVTVATGGLFQFSTALATNGSADGNHTVTVLAIDGLGNQSTQTYHFTLDTTVAPPSFTSPASGAVVNQNIIVTGKVPPSLTTPEVSIDSGVFVPLAVDASGNFSFTTNFAVNGTADGTHTITVRGTTPTQTILSNSVSFKLDTTAPSLVVTLPTDGAVITGNMNVVGTVADATSGVATLTMSIDGGTPVAATIDSAGNFSVPTSFAIDGSQEGPHTLTLRATDQAGNVNTRNVSITLVSVGTAVTFTSPAFGSTINSNVTITGKMVLTGYTDREFTMDDGDFSPLVLDASGNFSFLTTFALDGTDDGLHTYTIRAKDASDVLHYWNLQFTLSTTV